MSKEEDNKESKEPDYNEHKDTALEAEQKTETAAGGTTTNQIF
jgi:hypothetical protein